MPKWLRNLIFNSIRAYSFLRRNFYRLMDQLAAMLARGAMPAGTATPGGISPAEATPSSAPLLPGASGDVPDREVCSFCIY
jgi:hypothetical protein